MVQTTSTAVEEILATYLVDNHAVNYTSQTLPRDAPLLELQIIDSFAFMDAIAFIEATWGVTFVQSEQTAERLGSVSKMVEAVAEKLSQRENVE